MRIVLFLLLLVSLASPGPAVAQALPQPEQKANLTILVDANLMLPTAQLARAYANATGTPLTVVLKNGVDAEAQIVQGLEAHLLITANHALVERLAERGLTDVSSTRAIARTQLALVAAQDSAREGALARRISFGATISATPDMPVFLDDPSTPEGARAAALLSGYEFSSPLATRAVVQPNRVAVIEAVRREHGLGLLLAADALSAPDLTVVNLLPESISPPVTYEVVVLASESMVDARQVSTFLETKRAQSIFAHFGFQAP